MTEIRLSEAQQKNVWDGWLGAEIRANYFADLCGRYQRWQRLITFATLLTSSGAVAAILRNLDPAVQLSLALLTAALSLWSTVHNYNKSGTDWSDLHFRWRTLARQYEALWQDMYAPDSPATLAALLVKDAEIGKSSTAFPHRERLMAKWQDHVVSHHGGPAAA
jgi:hypothetical protein